MSQLFEKKPEFQLRPLQANWLSVLIITLTACDVPSINVGFGYIRLSLIILIAIATFTWKKLRVERSVIIAFIVFSLSLLPCLISSTNIIRSLGYYFFIVTDFFFLSLLFARQVAVDKNFIRAIIISYRIQILAGAVLVICGVHPRAQFLYYEPSYFALALILYIATAVYFWMHKGFRSVAVDLGFLLVALAITQSATLLLAGGVVLIVTVFYYRPLAVIIAIPASIAALYFAAVIYAENFDDLWAYTFRGILSASDPLGALTAIAERGGNRLPRLLAAYDIFLSHPSVGVGLGAYESFTEHLDLSVYYDNIEYLSVEGAPPINIYIEILATSGIIGFVGFLLFLAAVVRNACFSGIKEKKMFLIAFSSMLLMLNFESSYLRPYLWMVIGCLCGLAGTARENSMFAPVSGLRGKAEAPLLQTAPFR